MKPVPRIALWVLIGGLAAFLGSKGVETLIKWEPKQAKELRLVLREIERNQAFRDSVTTVALPIVQKGLVQMGYDLSQDTSVILSELRNSPEQFKVLEAKTAEKISQMARPQRDTLTVALRESKILGTKRNELSAQVGKEKRKREMYRGGISLLAAAGAGFVGSRRRGRRRTP